MYEKIVIKQFYFVLFRFSKGHEVYVLVGVVPYDFTDSLVYLVIIDTYLSCLY